MTDTLDAPDPPDAPPVIRVAPDRQAAVTDVLCEAFRAYPVMRFVLGEEADDPDRLRRLVDFFVSARFLRDEPVLGIAAPDEEGALAAAALVSFPGIGESPPELGELREAVWAELGSDARSRYETCGRTWEPLLSVDVPHIHLNMIGVGRRWRGRGLGGRILRSVHRLSRERSGSRGVTLTTEDPRNLPLYERFGYRRLGHARIAPELETWSLMWREEPSGA
ncbi:MAG TPA: GNAT family N-acetyltransferase [Longimicrobiales bacterium]|nr:GNAT family N-acetyltransferase [Longimicrobiales bacterium]